MHVTQRPLPQLPPVNLETDTVELDWSSPERTLPRHIEGPGKLLEIDSTYTSPNIGEPLHEPFASSAIMMSSRRMAVDGFATALAAAQQLNAGDQRGTVHAVIQDATDGQRYVVPLDIWEPVDESPFMWEDVGGTPHESPEGHVRITPAPAADGVDLEALVMDDGASWVNLTGHPVTLPGQG